MGGNSAWRKRVARGEPAKGSGGAALRHHPHLGRKGEDLKLNRKGNLGGRPNPKKKVGKRSAVIVQETQRECAWYDVREWSVGTQILSMIVAMYVVMGTAVKLLSTTNGKK